jgi:aminoglycoside phosphotransferase (APT) family kinase protein
VRAISDDRPLVIDRVTTYFARRLAPRSDVRVLSLTRMSEGFSQETFRVQLASRDGDREQTATYVLRRQPVAGLLEPYDTEPEFRVLAALAATPVRAPRVYWYERDPTILERPFYVMELVAGTVPLPVMVDGKPVFTDEERARLGEDFIANLAALHAVDWRGAGLDFLGVPERGVAAAARELARWEGYITRADGPPRPILTDAVLWLRRALPAADAVTLVHGDYRTGNFLVDGGRIVAVLDWEMVHLGDPMEDLGWACMALWRGESPYMCHLFERERLYARYEELSGRRVDPTRVHFYEVLATVKMAAIMLTGLHAFREGRTHDLRMALFDHQWAYMAAAIAQARGLL